MSGPLCGLVFEGVADGTAGGCGVGIHRLAGGAVLARGVFKNYNTVEEFKAADKTALFNQVADEARLFLSLLSAADQNCSR